MATYNLNNFPGSLTVTACPTSGVTVFEWATTGFVSLVAGDIVQVSRPVPNWVKTVTAFDGLTGAALTATLSGGIASAQVTAGVTGSFSRVILTFAAK
jgi:hypothetical protein